MQLLARHKDTGFFIGCTGRERIEKGEDKTSEAVKIFTIETRYSKSA